MKPSKIQRSTIPIQKPSRSTDPKDRVNTEKVDHEHIKHSVVNKPKNNRKNRKSLQKDPDFLYYSHTNTSHMTTPTDTDGSPIDTPEVDTVEPPKPHVPIQKVSRFGNQPSKFGK